MFYRKFGKRALDVILASLGLILAAPIIALVAVALFVEARQWPFFVQLRPGLYGRLFACVKLKTMRDSTDARGNVLPDSIRLTRVGAWARKWSLDELPQLLNVVTGDMSVVGPRPLMPKYLEFYSNEQARRHDVRPGISGLAQVNGRNHLPWARKFELDVEYVDHVSFKLDLAIIVETVWSVLRRKGINDQNGKPVEEFKGNV